MRWVWRTRGSRLRVFSVCTRGTTLTAAGLARHEQLRLFLCPTTAEWF